MTRKIITVLLFVAVTTSGAQAQKLWTLHDCMKYAIDNSPKNKIQDVNNDTYKKQYRDAMLNLLPSVSAGVNAGGNFGRGIDPETNTYTTMTTFSNNYSLSGSIPLFNGFSAVNGLRIAKISKLQGTEQSQQIQDQISLQTMQAYFNALYFKKMVELGQDQLDQSKKTLRYTQLQEELGLKGNADVLQAEAQVASDDYNLINQQNMHDDALLTLKQCMYYPIEEDLTLDTTAQWSINPLAVKESPDSIFQNAITTLPDLQLYQMDVSRAKLNHKTAVWQLLPSFSVSGGYSTGYIKASGNDMTETFSQQFKNRSGQSVSLNMSIPIFGGLARQSTIAYKRNQLRIAEYQFDQKKQEVESEIKRAVQDMEGAAKSYVLSVKKVLSQETSHAAMTRKFEEGLISIQDLQLSANDLLRAKAERLNNLFTYVIKCRTVSYYKGTPYIDQEF